MTTNANDLLGKLLDIAAPYAADALREALEDKVMPADRIRRTVEAVGDVFDELSDSEGNRRRALRRLRDMLNEFMDVDVEREVDDPILRQAVKLVRENVVGRREKEKLAEQLAQMLLDDWAGISADEMERIAGDDGLCETLRDRAEEGVDENDAEFIGAVVDLGTILTARRMINMPPAELNRLTARSVEILDAAGKGRSTETAFLDVSRAALESLGIMRVMRQAFAGLLLGDIILRQVGKSLGVTEKLSVTDFIFFLAAKVFDAQVVPEMDKKEIADIREKLDAALKETK